MIFEKNDKVLFIGDSITDCGRARPLGEGRGDALGKGYVSLTAALVEARYPELGCRFVNVGTSGHTVRNLQDRWQSDVLDQKPDWLSIMIGINDVWRQYDMPIQKEKHVYQFEYEKILDELIMQAKEVVSKGIIVISPYMIEPSTNDPMRASMDLYGKTCAALASKHGAKFVDAQAAFKTTLEHIHPMTLAWDRIHPSLTGHMVIARAFLNAVGFEW